ncbi:MAG: hypothetical protein QOF11_581, partial [Chloroflexota bacterium]|nr:hypothetical protein [Chloroflexota bacterium]
MGEASLDLAASRRRLWQESAG